MINIHSKPWLSHPDCELLEEEGQFLYRPGVKVEELSVCVVARWPGMWWLALRASAVRGG